MEPEQTSNIIEDTQNFIDEKARNTLSILRTSEQKETFARALKFSLEIFVPKLEESVQREQLSEKGRPVAGVIHDRFGFDLRMQKNYFISLNRKHAKEFLHNHGYSINTKFDKVYNRPLYKEKFGFEPLTLGTRQMILTYGEWLHLVDFPFPPKLPEFLKDYL